MSTEKGLGWLQYARRRVFDHVRLGRSTERHIGMIAGFLFVDAIDFIDFMAFNNELNFVVKRTEERRAEGLPI